MTARDDILDALPALRARLGTEVFTPEDVIEELARRNSPIVPQPSGRTSSPACAAKLQTTTP